MSLDEAYFRGQILVFCAYFFCFCFIKALIFVSPLRQSHLLLNLLLKSHYNHLFNY